MEFIAYGTAIVKLVAIGLLLCAVLVISESLLHPIPELEKVA